MKNTADKMKSFRTVNVWIPEFPEVARIISLPKELIYINLSARPGAKIVRLIASVEDWGKL